MNWEAIGAIAELVGAVGVILTLIFLIVQIRQNTRAIRAASYQASVAPISAMAVELGMNAAAAELLARYLLANQGTGAVWDRSPAARAIVVGEVVDHV